MFRKSFIMIFTIVISTTNIFCYSKPSFNLNLFIGNEQKVSDTTNPICIFWVDASFCKSCIIVAINHYSNEFLKINPSVNLITIIDTKSQEEIFVYKRQLKTKFVFADPSHYVKENFIPNDSIKNKFMVINRSGKILFSKENFSSNPLVDLNSILNLNTEKKSLIKLIKSIKLQENDSINISKIENVYFNEKSNDLIIQVSALNRILRYSVESGNILNIIKPPLEFKYHFADLNDTSLAPHWLWLDSIGSENVSLEELLINSKDTLLLITLFNKVHKLNDTTISYNKGRYFCKYNSGQYQFIDSSYIDKPDLYLFDFKNYGKDKFLCKSFNPSTEDTVNPTFLKNSHEFNILDTKSWQITKLLKYSDFNNTYLDTYYIPNFKIFATNGNEEFVAVDKFSKSIALFHGDSLISKLNNNGLLNKYFDGQPNILLKSLFLNKDKLVLLINNNKDSSLVLTIQIYSFSGQLIYENDFLTNDSLVYSKILNYGDNELILLNKWNEKRWTIDFLNIQ